MGGSLACCELLELDIPHEGHIKSVIWIRLVLEPEVPIEDHHDVSIGELQEQMGLPSRQWPFEISDYLVS